MEHDGALHARLGPFVDLLLRWNRTINLIARGDEGQVWERHVHDALQLRAFVEPHVARAIDLGSGAGFPGLVLAIATGITWELVEADARKASFLREAARLTAAPVRVHAVRAEAATLPPASLVTARALAPLPELLPLAHRFLRPDGSCIFPRGRTVARELTAARREWHMRVRQEPSRTAPTSTILLLSEIAPAGSPLSPGADRAIRGHSGREPEGRRGQDDDRRQSRGGPGVGRLPGRGD